MSLRVKKRVILFFLYLISIGLALMFLSPLLWMVVSSFKSETRIFSDLSSLKAFWPTEWIFDNYQTMQTRIDIVGNMITSLIYVSILVFLGLIVNSLCGFALAKYQFRYRNQLLSGIIALMIIPFESIVLPLYFVAFKLNILYTYSVLILPFIANCFSIFSSGNFSSMFLTSFWKLPTLTALRPPRLFYHCCPILSAGLRHRADFAVH